MSNTFFFSSVRKAIVVNLLLLTAFFNASAEVVFNSEHNVGSWDAQQLPVGTYSVLAKASEGDVVAINVTAVETGARITLQDIGWQGFADEYDCEVGRHYFVLSASDAAKLNEGGLIVTGEKYTFDKVELLYRKPLWEGTVDDNTGWGQSDVLENDLFAALQEGDLLGIGITAINDGESWHQVAIRGDYENILSAGISEAKTLLSVLTAEQVDALKTKTVDVTAQYLKVSGLYTYVDNQAPATDEDAQVVWEGSQAIGVDEQGHVDLSYGNKGSLSQTFMTDVLRITYTATDEDAYIQLSNPAGWVKLSEDAFEEVDYSDETKTFEYTVANASVLEVIQLNGVLVKGKNINVTKVELVKKEGRYDAVPATIGEDGFATFSSSKKLSFAGAGITPYYASEINVGSVTLTSVDNKTTWGYEGYVLRGAPGSYEIPVIESGAVYPSGNYLKATSDYATTVYRSVYSDYSGTDDNATKIKTYYRYIFAKDSENNIGFYKLVTDYELGAHKAYLETSTDVTPAAARVSLLFSDDETTAVQTIEAIERPQSDKIYNISGQQVGKPTRGFYIINGKKVIIK